MQARFSLLLQLLLFLWSSLAQADPVYTWIDSAGTTHFSQTPPADPSTDTSVLELPPPGPYDPAVDDYYSVANQAARMEARRLEAEKLRAETEALRAQAAAADSPPVSEPPAAPEYFYPYSYPVYRYPQRDWRPPHHKPHHHPAPMPYHSERPVTTPHFPANPQPRRKFYEYQQR
jgi:hypothetical protein